MKHAEKLVGVAMALYADYETGGNVCPSNGTIARELGYGGKAPEQTVNKIVGKLRRAGWLTKTGKVPDGPVIYRLTLPKQGGMAEEPYNLHTFKGDGGRSEEPAAKSKPVGEERPPGGGRQSEDEERKQPAKVGRASGPQQEDEGAGSLGGPSAPSLSFVNLETVKQEERRRKWFGGAYAAPVPVNFDYDGLTDRLPVGEQEPPPF
ncbi:helix-turn-helix domain-containing protein [Streptomyces antarcticus]|uniref:helix-turn-helix domain-containing protein n=1 Tax=Streptomyces antarcticus TaxID=2996458 RepID=UPI002270CD8E|nr:helix-turn-helix domain-containing protein [Streptomyces sp. H34-AA3]MCY0941302.1 helix-turn-helix domain-containing protein [Streptomyces sp. H34-AA3]